MKYICENCNKEISLVDKFCVSCGKLFEEIFELVTVFDGYFDLDKYGDYILYHATPSQNIESIKKEGIKPSIKTGSKYGESLVWLANSKEVAIKHCKSRMIKKGIEGHIKVIEVKLNPFEDKLYKAIQPGIYTVEGIVEPEKFIKIY